MGNAYNGEQNNITRESMETALFFLMKKKAFHDVSITELTKKAGVSRMAYYRNYKEKQEILLNYLNRIFQEYFKEIKNFETLSDSIACELFFRYFRKIGDRILIIVNSDLSYLILKQFDFYIEKILSFTPKTTSSARKFEKYKHSYISGGMYNVLLSWLRGGLKESDNNMAEIITKLYKT
jgi:AcrR family transcriptional regulator